MRLTHRQKVRLARKMRTQKEMKKTPSNPRGVPIFLTKAWGERVEAIKRRVERKKKSKSERK